MTAAPERPDDCLYYLVSRATLAVSSALRRGLVEAGVEVRPAYLGVLLSLWQEDDAQTAELGRRAGLEPSTMTGLLDRMERDGLIQRRVDPDDRRAQRIKLTERGRRVRPLVMRVVDAGLARVTRGFSKAEQTQFKELLQKLIRSSHSDVCGARTRILAAREGEGEE